MNFTISDLKKELGPGLGLRKSKYLIEIPIPGIEGRSLNILCRSAGLPERNIATVSAYHKGRKFNMRAETDYTGSYEISLVDDSSMNVRKIFDKWMIAVDNSKPKNVGFLGSSFEGILEEIEGLVTSANNVQTGFNSNIEGFFLGFLDPGNANAASAYQTDVNIWQLSSGGEKVYGYKLQNCFPSSVGVVTLDDGEENTLSEFSVVLTFSEFIPLTNSSFVEKTAEAIAGDTATSIFSGIQNL